MNYEFQYVYNTLEVPYMLMAQVLTNLPSPMSQFHVFKKTIHQSPHKCRPLSDITLFSQVTDNSNHHVKIQSSALQLQK